jgi:GSH-dependent disulfide-bond oxidoreductase
LPYRAVPIHIGKGEQFAEDFLRINPNGKIPAITDRNGSDGAPITIFESGAIMIYLANRYGKQFLPDRERDHYAVLQWLMFQMGGVGSMLGQTHHFRKFAPTQIDYAIERYTREATRLYAVIEKRLQECEYLAGSYSIADMAVYPWLPPLSLAGAGTL